MGWGARGVVLALALLLLLGAGLSGALASSEGGHGGGDKGKKGEKKEPGKAVDGVIDIGPLVVNVLSNRGYRYFRLGLQVTCADNGSAERLMEPDCREDLIMLLSSKLAEDLLTSPGKIVLRKELIELFKKYAGPDKVKDLYYTEFVFQ